MLSRLRHALLTTAWYVLAGAMVVGWLLGRGIEAVATLLDAFVEHVVRPAVRGVSAALDWVEARLRQ